METLLQDIRFGFRMLRKSPGFTTVAVLTLAVGIGANTAIFSVINAVLLRPLAYRDPQQLVMVWSENPQRAWTTNPVYPQDYVAWREQSHAFSQMAAYQRHSYNLVSGHEPVEVTGMQVTGDLFPLLGIRPERGRGLTTGDNLPGAARVVVLSQGLWQERHGADPLILGKQIVLNRENYEVVGVMPAGFEFPPASNGLMKAALWVPLVLDAAGRERTGHSVFVVGRLRPGVKIEQAQAEMTTIAQRLAHDYPKFDEGWTATVVDLQEQMVGSFRPALLVLLAAVAAVLLIACVNVANLALARSLKRQREVAIRVAVGAARFQIVRQFLTESVLMALTAAVIGIGFATTGLRVLLSLYGQQNLALQGVAVDGRVLVFTLLLAMITGVVSGLAPAFSNCDGSLSDALKHGTQASGEGKRNRRVRSILVVSEFAVALVLLVGAGLLIRSFLLLRKVNPGFDGRNVLTMNIPLAGARYADETRQAQFFDNLLPRIESLPGVQAASTALTLPLTGRDGMYFVTEENPTPPANESPEANYQVIGPDYFRAMGIPLLKGRAFTPADRHDSQPVVIINENVARMYWPNADPIGRRIRIEPDAGTPWATIVAIVGNVRSSGLGADFDRETYVPYTQYPWMANPRNVVVRTTGNPLDSVSAIRQAIAEVDSAQPISEVATMDEVAAQSISYSTFSAALLGTFGAIALLLASMGIYSVIAYSASQRSREIGIRMTFGARPRDVVWLIVSQGTRLATLGVALGLVGAFGLTRLMTSMLFGVGATDPFTYAGVATLLGAVAVAACFIPARRAAKVDPIVALRYE
jgi:putative ABC transport system permease protein